MKVKNFFKAIGFTLLILVIYLEINVGLTLIVGIIVSLMNYPSLSQEQMISEIGKFIVPILLITNIVTLAFIIIIFLARKEKFFNYIGFRKIKVTDAILILGLGVFVSILITGLLDLAIMYFPLGEQMKEFEKLMKPLVNSGFIPIILAVSVSAPIFEEIVFRGIIFNDFKKAFPVWLAILTQALLFGLFHGNLIQGIYATMLGVILGVVYYKYKSIWAVILLHFAYNTASILLDQLLHNNLSLDNILLLGFGGSLLFAIIMIRFYKKENYYKIGNEVQNVKIVD